MRFVLRLSIVVGRAAQRFGAELALGGAPA